MFICALNSPSSIAGFFGLKVENCELLDYSLGVLCVLCSWKMGKQASKHGRYLEKARNVTSLYMCVYCVCCVFTGHCPPLGRRGRGDYRAMERGYDIPPLLSG